jgi:hypothetical protein
LSLEKGNGKSGRERDGRLGQAKRVVRP